MKDNKNFVKLDKNSIPSGEEGRQYAQDIKNYILRTSKFLKVTAVIWIVLTCLFFVWLVLCYLAGLEIDSKISLAVTLALLCLMLLAAVTLGVKMYKFRKFLKKFE